MSMILVVNLGLAGGNNIHENYTVENETRFKASFVLKCTPYSSNCSPSTAP